MNKWPIFWLLFLTFFCFTASAKEVWVIPVQGAIGPATSDYIEREFQLAQQQDISLMILKMDTPGGLDSAMRSIIQNITSSTIPVATWVGPNGARAASAGTYILLASHIAAMANATNLGAATPVAIGISGPESSPSDENSPSSQKDAKNSEQVSAKTTLEKKVINDASAYIKGLAKLHGRNEEWAEKAVREAASIDAQTALAGHVIDFIADNLEQVIEFANGREILLLGNKNKLSLDEVSLIERVPDWRYSFLATITNPNIAYILMLIGIYGLILEFYSPGVGLPGVLGGICLVLAMYAMQMLPINYAGLAFILLGLLLLVAEAFSPSFGALGLGGIVSFILGSIFLMDSDLPEYQIAKPLIMALALLSTTFILLMIALLLKIRRKTVTTGVDRLVGRLAIVKDDFDTGQGWVEIAGEIWHASSADSLLAGQKVRVKQVSGLNLIVCANEKNSLME
ncbi:membrane-bound serine protease (ClpP class) [Psychromonas ingrahamii 37]|uniref:Membrane-bound serine protease (ClpP class) n=1 Tax=Psychromonas ingrahamii (strain DSM 17664 / CCUG 51855 / 37) TaxID=357804 RepID=A1SVC0_PSYIN|nr:nodulation protein NfeD [Psychromonas ingrahamii]ABM03435.1 membrane-bound serine protease (ClpP class) [Psychromonas ingrahamii 37]